METFFVQQPVYFCARNKGWNLGTVQAVQPDGKLVVVSQADPAEKATVAPAEAHGVIDNAYDPRDADLFRVGDLHVSTLLYCLKSRFESVDAQYSKMGEMILSVNPFRPMPFNSQSEMEKYLGHPDPIALPPHVWQIAHKSFTQIVVRNQGNQSVVISGESGSGKTENTKTLINFLGQMSYKRSCNAVQKGIADRVSDKLKWSNPILESFGNARTVRNDNSSRFGKYTKLFFDRASGVMVGGEMVTYLLEKSRIIMQGQGERNYHVFYEMLAGLPPNVKADLHLKNAQDYDCLAGGNTLHRRGVDGANVDDGKEFSVLVQAMTEMGISAEQQMDLWKVLASILHLSQVKFEKDDNDKACIPDDSLVAIACQLLGISKDALLPCFLVKSKTKIMTMLASKKDAEALRDAFIKALYVSLFDCMVEVVNVAIKPDVDTSNAAYIGVLDIFGFENFKKNSFEQLCINFANETLQNHYNKYTFLNDEEECKAEGITFPPIEFPDNKPCLEMFQKPKSGIFPLLDEECNFAGGTTGRYTTNVWENWTNKNEYFMRPKSTVPDTFGVHHYAADVMYNTDEWLEKNADSLKDEAKTCIQGSTSPFIAKLLDKTETQAADGQRKKRVTVASRFRTQLDSLRSELESTETHFIRCIKPNMEAAPKHVDNQHVGMQLESAGVLQTIALKRQGYPLRRLHKDFSAYFFPIAPRQVAAFHGRGQHVDSTSGILAYYQRLYGWEGTTYAVGNTKVFLKDFIWHKLEKLLIRKNRWRLRKVVPYLSAWAQRFRAKKAEEERRRQEQLRKLKEEAERRRQAEEARAAQAAAGGTATPGEPVPPPQGNGLDGERQKWFQEFCLIFPHFDYATLSDIAFQAKQKDQALQFLSGMQQQQLDAALPANLQRIFTECGFRPGVTEALAVRGIASVAELEKLSTAQMKELGMNDDEVNKLTQYLISQQSEVVVQQQLQSVLGTADFNDVFRNIAQQAAQQHQQQTARDEGKIAQLAVMGFDPNEAHKALQHTNGDVAEAAMMLSTGQPIPERPAASAAPAAPAVTAPPPPPPQQQPRQAPPPPTTAPQPQVAHQMQPNHRPLPQAPPPQQQQQPMYTAPPPMQHSPSRSNPNHVTGSAQPHNAGAVNPSGVVTGIPQTRPPPLSSTSEQFGRSGPPRPGVGGPPLQRAAPPPQNRPPPQQQAAPPGLDQAEVQKYVSMGFPQQKVIEAMQACGGDPNAVLSMLLAS